MAYLTSRDFGLRAFGEIYGYAFATYVLAGALGPWLMGPDLMTVRETVRNSVCRARLIND